MQEQNEKLGRKLNRLLNHCDVQHEQMNVVLGKLKKMEEESAEVHALYSILIHKENNNHDELINLRNHLEKTILEKEAIPKSEALNNDLKRRLGESESQRKKLQEKHDHSESQKKELQQELEHIKAQKKELQKKDDQSEVELQEAYKEFINVCMYVCLHQLISVGVSSFSILVYLKYKRLAVHGSKV